MAHFAELNASGDVLRVVVVYDALALAESNGISWLQSIYGKGSIWKQTSYSTFGGVYYDANKQPATTQEKSLRKNYAGVGYKYDAAKDAFIAPAMGAGYLLDEQKCQWVATNVPPNDGNKYYWDEKTSQWVKVSSVAITATK
jgi:hypothetical protein